MKSLASSDVSENSGSSRFHLAARMLFRVSLSSSPRNGERPLRLRGREHNFLFVFYNSSHIHLCTLMCSLTACTWWRRGSTCLCWTTQSHSWLPQERGTLEYQNSPEASPAVYSCVRDYNLNPSVLHYCFHQLDSTHTRARPKSMILILLVSLLTQRMFSGWNSSANTTIRYKELSYELHLKRHPLKKPLPLNQGAAHTFCACAADLHRSAEWTSQHPAPLKCSFHQWSCQTALLHRH